jgi:hypothetical protein
VQKIYPQKLKKVAEQADMIFALSITANWQ